MKDVNILLPTIEGIGCISYPIWYNPHTMKKDIHPTTNAIKATCACGASYDVASTSQKIEVEICAQCHPFYTGQEKIVDTAGRVEKFKARMSKIKK